MSEVLETKDAELESQPHPSLEIAVDKKDWLSRLSNYVSEFCSSILVKETRQALKSKQFLFTYFLLLIGVGIWTVTGIAFGDTDYDSNSAGRELLQGFWVILGFPLGVIIPFSAYRSLAREFEDGTIHLISITTMKPYQIVFGKFGSAILQMLVYLSVLAPCILFTYMLRGVSLESILFGLLICISGSLALTTLGLFLAGAIRSRALGIGLSVLFILLLGWLYFLWVVGSSEVLDSSFPGFEDPEVVAVFFGFLAMTGSTSAVLLAAATSQISFFSDNRSTKIRAMMIVQQALFLALIVVIVQVEPFQTELFLAMTFVVAHYWLIMGFLMVGESPIISRRVQRSLPKSILARSLFSMLMPGPGRGFLFALSMMWACALTLALMMIFQSNLILDRDIASGLRGFGRRWNAASVSWTIAAIVACCFYASFFLSVCYVAACVFLHRRRLELPTGISQLICLVLGVVIVVFPTLVSIIWYANYDYGDYRGDYPTSQIFNWYWTTIEIGNERGEFLGQLIPFSLMAAGASIVILIAIAIASRELLHRPIPVPQRVLIDREEECKIQLPPGESIEEIFGELT